ncbi:MAG: response regulator [Polyangiaceae bacterium]|jgi:CheY-like chemotaxis protein|nr:response regulator [Polyangiaceae bacterium]
MSNKKKVLVVDDEQDVLTFLTTLFEDNGYETVTAEDGEEAFRKAQSERPDLITLDMSMPEHSGVRTFRDLKAHDELKAIPVIIVTGIGEPMQNFLNKMRNSPKPEGFVSKPIDRQELLRMANDLTTRGSA